MPNVQFILSRYVQYDIVTVLVICVILDIVLGCKPDISEGSHSKQEIHGYTYLDCDFESCDDVHKITYEKRVEEAHTWVAVFEANQILHQTLETSNGYSLQNRTRYAPFDTQHILSIKPLISADYGYWRCVIHDTHGNRIPSQTMMIDFASGCKLKIAEGLYSKLEINGHVSFQCDTCGSIHQISFDKKDINGEWKTLYVTNMTNHHATLVGTDTYSIENRTRYIDFPNRHILYINPLALNDVGKWRCVTYAEDCSRTESNTIELSIVSAVGDSETIKPNIYIVYKDSVFKFLCEIDNIYYEPPVIWMSNGTELEPGDHEISQQVDQNLVKSVLELPIDMARKSRIECKMKSKGNPGTWTWNSIGADIEDGLKGYPGTQIEVDTCNYKLTAIVTTLIVIAVEVLCITLYCLVLWVKKRRTHQNSANLTPMLAHGS